MSLPCNLASTQKQDAPPVLRRVECPGGRAGAPSQGTRGLPGRGAMTQSPVDQCPWSRVLGVHPATYTTTVWILERADAH